MTDHAPASNAVRTRFAPSPTGYLHIGGARTALFSWAYARRHQGTFILRIEDTDLERSTPESVQAILDGMSWLGLQHDEGPFYQMQRMDRYREVLQQMLASGDAYYCYASREELEAMREAQRAAGEKPRYDGRWRPEPGKTLPPVPQGIEPVIRFRNPTDGEVSWHDLVKGPISFANAELDDLIIARSDGTPTYNFCVVIDDWDMRITHVIRGDDHVNNTPRQINILRALGAQLPAYAHVPMILGDDGERLSKRHGAVSVLQYQEDGYLPEALLNYLARLGWAHGDAEIFSLDQLTEWFDLAAISRSPARFNPEKLLWLNQQYIKVADNQRLAGLIREQVASATGHAVDQPDLAQVVGLLKERAATLPELAAAAGLFYRQADPEPEQLAVHLDDAAIQALRVFREKLADIDWERAAIHDLIKATVSESGLKMPKIAMPLRLMTTGTAHTPAIDATLHLLGRQHVLGRLDRYLANDANR